MMEGGEIMDDGPIIHLNFHLRGVMGGLPARYYRKKM